jgi:predicted nucleic acid-binding protein
VRRQGLTLDAGALIALEKGQRLARSVITEALAARRPVHVVSGVVAQVWRDGARQAHLARLLSSPGVTLVSLDPDRAKLVGEAIGVTGHPDIVDVHVALHALQHDHVVVTSDPDDLRAVDPSLTLIEV